MTICIPSMQEWGAIFGASQASVQLTFSGYVVASGSLQLLYGPLSDRLGRKKILLTGLTLAGLGSVLAAVAPDLLTLTVARVLQGAGGAAGMVVGRAMVQDLFHGTERTHVMAYIGMAMGLCAAGHRWRAGPCPPGLGANFGLIAVLLSFDAGCRRGLPDHQPSPSVQPTGCARCSRPTLAWPGAGPPVARQILSTTTATFYASVAPDQSKSYGVGPEGIGHYISIRFRSWWQHLTTHLGTGR
jgi:DHA1 family bicyclomycin/chloramphenicol resistance-like MFS transporter